MCPRARSWARALWWHLWGQRGDAGSGGRATAQGCIHPKQQSGDGECPRAAGWPSWASFGARSQGETLCLGVGTGLTGTSPAGRDGLAAAEPVLSQRSAITHPPAPSCAGPRAREPIARAGLLVCPEVPTPPRHAYEAQRGCSFPSWHPNLCLSRWKNLSPLCCLRLERRE